MALIIGGKITIGPGITVAQETGVAIAAATTATPWIVAYPFSTNSGFGTRYANPSVLMDSIGSRRCAFNPAGTALAVSNDSHGIDVYAFNYLTGFGIKYANASPVPNVSSVFDVAWSPDGTVLAICGTSAPYIEAYQWIEGVGFGTKYADPANPSTITSSQLNGVAFNPAGTVIAAAGSAQSNQYALNAWPWSNSTGFGTRYTAPASTLGLWFSGGVAWNPSGRSIAATGTLAVYSWSDSTGFGTQYTNPGSVPAGTDRSVAWSTTGAALFTGGSSPYMAAWAWSDTTGFGTQYSLPATSPPSTAVYGIAVRQGNNAVAATTTASAAPKVWTWSDATGFGTKYSDPGTWTGGAPKGLAFCP